MSKIFTTDRFLTLAGILSLVVLLALGLMICYLMMTTVQESLWTAEIGGKEITVIPVSVITEGRDIPPFTEHLEDYQKRHCCNCIIDSQDQIQPGGFTGGIGIGGKWYYWGFPKNHGTPFSFRSFGHHGQTLIRQRVTNQFGFKHSELDWRIVVDGYLSEDGQHYYLSLRHDGGNFADHDVDYYAEFDTETQRLTLHVRQKLYREKYKRYQFEFEVQDNPTPSHISRGEGEIQSLFVPITSSKI